MTKTEEEFEGRVAVVTGGASGIGLATAAELARRGARVAVLDIKLGELPAPLAGYVADITDRSSVAAAIEQIAARYGGIDVVINNAGIGAVGTVEDNDDAEWTRVLDLNVIGLVRVSRAALPWLRRSTVAAIVNTCSIAATNGLPARALYSASKGAVQSLTMAMATDHLRERIRVNCVLPGTADTPWVERLVAQSADPIAERAALESRQAIGRLVSADEVARAIVYLASPLSGSTTGTSLEVDGGLTHLRIRETS